MLYEVITGLVHHDFKLDNVLIGEDGRPRISDFGLVKPAELEPPEDRGAFMVIMAAPEGASFEYTLEHMMMLEDQVLFPMLETGEFVNSYNFV